MNVTHSHASSAGAINHLLMRSHYKRTDFIFHHSHDSQGGESRIMSEVLLTHINLVVPISVLMDDSVEELLLHCVVSDIIDFIIKQVLRTRPMIADDESNSLT